MNKIVFKNNSIITKELDDKIELVEINCLVPTFKITFTESTELEITFDSGEETKVSFEYKLDKNINVNLYEIRSGAKTKVQYKYDIDEYSKLYLFRLNKAENIRELDLINLDGENSSVEFNLRTLSTTNEKYDIYVSHNERNTSSVLNNIGIALKGGIIFNVTGDVPKGMSGSYLDQNNQIVTFNKEKCQINPNLLVEEFDVEAEHNAVIGAFDDDTIFYLMSRGISEDDAIRLLSEGLVINNLKENYDKEQILDFINEYWG